MFTINQGFDLNSPQFNFKRDYFASVADLKAAAETNFPDHFITNVAGVLYQLTKSNSVDTTTGKWRKVKLGSDVDLSSYAKSADVANTYAKKSEAIRKLIIGNASDGSISIGGVFVSNAGNVSPTPDTDVVIPVATSSTNGIMLKTDKAKLDGIAANANNYTLPTATTAALGGIKTGYTTNGKNYKVQVDASGNAFVNVPWTDNQDLSGYAKLNGGNEFVGLNEFKDENNSSAYTTTISGSDISISKGPEDTAIFAVDNAGEVQAKKFSIIDGGTANKLLASDGSLFDASTLATTAALATTNTNVTNLTNTLNNIQASNKIKSTALPIASTTALGAIKLGKGLTATADGTVNVSSDVVAGSVEWNNVKNKPTLLEAGDNVSTTDSFQAVSSVQNGTKLFTLNPLYGISVSFISDEGAGTTTTTSMYYGGIQKIIGNKVVKNNVFMTDGTTAELTSITTDELNAILV